MVTIKNVHKIQSLTENKWDKAMLVRVNYLKGETKSVMDLK